jgi:voltage-gated potassium channel Kch
MFGSQSNSLAVNSRLKSIHAWQDRIRDPSFTALLILEICLIFIAAPLAAKGLPVAGPIIQTIFFVVIMVVVMLSRRRGAIATILLGLGAILASVSLGSESSPLVMRVLHRGGDILTLSALTWVVSDAVYAPGRITFHRLRGAAVMYLNFAMIFASFFSLIRDLNPAGFTGLPAAAGGLGELATMLYFSLTTLTTTGYGDIVPVDPFARSLANLEAVIGPFFLAITVAKLVTLELDDRRR